MYYDRSLEPEFLSLLKEGGPLRPLVDLTEATWRSKNIRPDLQFRSNTVSLYLGLTKVLQIRMDAKGNLHPSSAGAYGLKDHGVQPVYGLDESSDLVDDVRRFLDQVDVRDRYLSDEGYCQNWLSYRYGSTRVPGHAKPLAIDREVVIGYAHTKEKESLWEEPIRQRALKIAESISDLDAKRYGSDLHLRPLGNELDLLMWEPPATFLVTEVKGGRNAHGVYMAPVQLAAYTMVWRHFAQEQSVDGIKDLVRHKRELGLVKMDDAEWEEFTASLATPEFVPALVVQNPKRKSSCWKKLGEVIEHIDDIWSADWGPSVTDSLRVYTVDGPEGGLVDRTADYRSW